jgi:hypothetical protein
MIACFRGMRQDNAGKGLVVNFLVYGIIITCGRINLTEREGKGNVL